MTNEFDRIFLFNGIARKVIQGGKSWHIMLSMQVVLMTAVVCALLVTPSSRQNFQANIWIYTLALMSLWGILVFWTSTKRSVSFDRPVDIEVEAYCLALPFLLLPPGLILIKLLPDCSIFMLRAMFHGRSGLLLVVLLAVFAINLLGVIHLLITEKGIQDSLKSNSSRWVAGWLFMRLLDSKHGTGNSLVLMLLVVISGGIYFGYRNPLSLSVPSTPVVRGLVIAIGAIVFWAASSWICGSYRCKKLGDFRGMKSAILSIGRSLMHFFLALSITCIVLTLVTANVSDAYVKSVASNILVLLVILITVYAILDIICVINGLLVTSSRYRPLLDINEDTLGPIEPPDEHSLGTITRLDRASHQIGMIEPPPAKTSASSLVQLLTLQSTRSDQAILKCSPDMSIALRIQGIVFLALSVIAQGFAVCVIGKAALVRFMSTNIHDLDFLSGLGSALIYTLLMAAALCGTLRIFRQKTHISVICSSVGFSLLPLSLAVFILSLLPLQVRDGAYGLLFTCALMWGLGYLVMDIGSSLIQRSRLFLALPAIVLVIVTTHFASGYLIKNAHLAVMRSMTIPLRSVENTIVDEFPPSMGGEVRSLIGSMVNVDRADVSAADFVDQVLYSKKVSTRFYEEGQYPSNLSPFRIRAEITANAGWMRRLFPEMSRLTRSAKTPDDVVRIVSKWLKAKMVEITPMTWPPGEKFDQDPITTLICKRGNQMDAAILMIAALRASGVAARTKLFFPDELVTNSYTLAEYFDGVEWKPCYPKIGWVSKPAVRRDDLAKFKQWAYSVPKGSGPSLNILIDGVWYPYCNGRTQPITFTFDPAPGTYMGSYTTGNVCHIRRFVLRPSGK